MSVQFFTVNDEMTHSFLLSKIVNLNLMLLWQTVALVLLQFFTVGNLALTNQQVFNVAFFYCFFFLQYKLHIYFLLLSTSRS